MYPVKKILILTMEDVRKELAMFHADALLDGGFDRDDLQDMILNGTCPNVKTYTDVQVMDDFEDLAIGASLGDKTHDQVVVELDSYRILWDREFEKKITPSPTPVPATNSSEEPGPLTTILNYMK
jgi:hypothetical protein